MRKRTFWHVCVMKIQISLRTRGVWSVFVDHMEKLRIFSYPKWSQWRFWSACATAQADLNLRWAHVQKVRFLTFRVIFCNLIKETSETAFFSSYLDLYLHIDNGKLTFRLYNKRDNFNFSLLNFPFLSSNIPSTPAYDVNVSQLIRYARACSEYQDNMNLIGATYIRASKLSSWIGQI